MSRLRSPARVWVSVPCENPSAAPCHRSLHVCAIRQDALYIFGGARRFQDQRATPAAAD